MSDILCKMIGLAKEVGIVVSANMYDSGFITVDGKAKDGKKFCFTLHIEEEKENA